MKYCIKSKISQTKSNLYSLKATKNDSATLELTVETSNEAPWSNPSFELLGIKADGNAWVKTEDENRFEINGECKSVNIEIIIYLSEDVMTASTQQLEEAPTLELPKKIESEEALQITNETAYNISYLPCLKINN